jgi:hypothetical protein
LRFDGIKLFKKHYEVLLVSAAEACRFHHERVAIAKTALKVDGGRFYIIASGAKRKTDLYESWSTGIGYQSCCYRITFGYSQSIPFVAAICSGFQLKCLITKFICGIGIF